MRILTAAIQMPSNLLDASVNIARADEYLRQARDEGVELAVLPELFNTGYSLVPDFGPVSESIEGPTIAYMRRRSMQWKMSIAAGFVERDGRHLYDSLAFTTPDGEVAVYRKRNLVFWERFRFNRGHEPLVVQTPFGRVGFAICADMIYRKVWDDYRNRIDVAIVSAAWPDFANRHTGKAHWLLGHVGPMSASIPGKVARDLGIPVVFANQCGETRTMIPLLGGWIDDRFAGRSSICDGLHGSPLTAGADPRLLIAPITIHQPKRGRHSWHTMSPSAHAVPSSASAHS